MNQNIKQFICLLVISCIWGCSNDDSSIINEGQETIFSDVTLISEDRFVVFKIDVFNEGEEFSTLNLNETLGFSNFDLLYANPPLLTFFEVTADNFNVYELNLENSQPYTQQGICDYPFDEFRRGPYVSETKIGFVSTQDNVPQPMNYLNTRDKINSFCLKSEIGNGDIVGSRYVYDEYLYLTIVENNERFIIRRINLNNPNFIEDLIFNDVFKATVQDDVIHIFHPDNSYDVYDKDSFTLIRTTSFEYSLLSVNLGLFNAEIKDNILYFDFPYQQPSPISDGPATIDLNLSEYLNGQDQFALRLRQKLNNQLESNLELTDFAFDIENNLIIYGYDIGESGGEGGIVYTNFDADILKTISLPYVPEIIIVR